MILFNNDKHSLIPNNCRFKKVIIKCDTPSHTYVNVAIAFEINNSKTPTILWKNIRNSSSIYNENELPLVLQSGDTINVVILINGAVDEFKNLNDIGTLLLYY